MKVRGASWVILGAFGVSALLGMGTAFAASDSDGIVVYNAQHESPS